MKNEINRALVAKKKLFSIFALLTLSVGLWATTQTVSYLYPVYNTDGVATSGIKEWKTDNVTATVVESSTEQVTWGTAGATTWYVVTGANITLSKGAVCAGEVHLILADGAKLTATGAAKQTGINVKQAEQDYLTIYSQSTGAQMGQLIANGGDYAAGIGDILFYYTTEWHSSSGGNTTEYIPYFSKGGNITINGGEIMAVGGSNAAGIGGGEGGTAEDIIINGGVVTATGGENGAGIGGGKGCNAENITINGGTVTATGGNNADGIGSGEDGSASSNIFVNTKCTIKADGNNPPQTTITNNGGDLAGSLKGKQYATVETPKNNLTANDFEVSNTTATYDGTAKAATVALNPAIGDAAGAVTVSYKQSSTAVTNPTNAGEYDIYAAVAEGTGYNAFASAKVGTLTISKATLTAENFTFAAPADLIWNGKAKNATVTFDDQSGKLTGCGAVTIKYNDNATAPSAAGDYTVSIDVAEGTNYNAVTALTTDDWKFTITKATLTADDFTISNTTATYDGEAKAATVALKESITGAGEITVTYQQGETEVATPTNAGEYAIFATVTEGESYEAFEAAKVGTLTINKATLTADNFIYTAPANLTWDGNAKYASVTFDGQSGKLTGCGNVTIKYNDSEQAPINAGTYTVSIDVAEGTNFAATAAALTKDDWKFTITKATLTAEDFVISADPAIYNGDAKAATITKKEGIGTIGTMTITYKQGEMVVDKPTNAGSYDIYLAVVESDNYTALTETQVGTLTINKATLTAEDFIYTAPADLIWNGNPKTATVTFDDPSGKLTGCGNVTIKYNDSEQAPINAGTYTVSIDVAEGTNFAATATALTDDAWKFTITKATLTAEDFTISNTTATYDGGAHTATVTLKESIIGAGNITVTYKLGDEVVTPINAGEYDIYVSVTEGDNYNALEATKVGTLTIAKIDLTEEDFTISNTTATYDGDAKAATVTFKEGITGAGTITVTYKLDDEVVTPINANVYAIYAAVSEGTNYNAFEATKVGGELIISQATPTTDLFTVKLPENLVYDGTPKTATVTFNDQGGKLTGINFIVWYDYSPNAPDVVGTHVISIKVLGGPNYVQATLEDDAWQFTIEPPVEEWDFVRFDVNEGDWSTICIKRTITDVVGATFWNVVEETETAFMLEQEFAPFDAGVGYIIQYTATELKVMYEGGAVKGPVAATSEHPIQGNFEEIECDQEGKNDLVGNYVVYQNQLCKVTGWVTMAEHHAYVIADLAPKQVSTIAKGPRMTMAKPNNTPTGFGQWSKDKGQKTMKVIENGQFRIVRDNKMYNAQGIIIK